MVELQSLHKREHISDIFVVGGDSGAWVIQNGTHRVVGHVLAWCERNKIAYICPMEVLLEDIKRTLGAKRIYLPGSTEEIRHIAKMSKHTIKDKGDSRVDELEAAIEGLAIVDPSMSHTAMGVTTSSPLRRSRLGLPLLNTGGENDKENVTVLRSRVLKVNERRGGQLGMVGVP
jgi:hypothetical protein